MGCPFYSQKVSTSVIRQLFVLTCPGGLFEYVSCANYLGEALEWTGYAIACWSAVAAQFCVWTYLFLGSRALQHHRSAAER